MKKKLQVFVSSTWLDLLEERQAAVEAILRAEHIPAGMELFAASDAAQLETIHQWIEDSDVFMLILGGRYGSIEPKSGKSYTECEYDYALKKKKPLFAAVIQDTFLADKVKKTGGDAQEKDNGKLLKDFKGKVTSRTCRFFGDLNELKVIVLEALFKHDRDPDLVGWVRGDEVIDAKATLEQMGKLQAENEELRRRVSELEEAAELVSGPERIQQIAAALEPDAAPLLVAAAAGDGRIGMAPETEEYTVPGQLKRGSGGKLTPQTKKRQIGIAVSAGGKVIWRTSKPREQARYTAVIEEIMSFRLIGRDGWIGPEYGSSKLTDLGFQVADVLAAATSPSQQQQDQTP